MGVDKKAKFPLPFIPSHQRLCHNEGNDVCHSEPFAMCHPERSEGSRFLAQGKLHEESHRVNKLENRDSSLPAGGQGLTPQNDITTQSPRGGEFLVFFSR